MGRRTPVHAEIIIYDQDQVERMIKKFIKKVKKCGVLDELKEKRYYTKKSDRKRKKRIERKRLAQQATKKYKESFRN